MSTTIRAQLDVLREAYGAGYELLQRDLYRFLLSRVGGAAQVADELSFETLHRGWERLLSFRGINLRAWLFRIAHNLAVDHIRAQHKQGQPLPEELPDRSSPDEEARETLHQQAKLLRQFQQQLQTFQALLERLAQVLPEPEERQGRPSRQTLLPRQVKILRQASNLACQYLEEELGQAPGENHI